MACKKLYTPATKHKSTGSIKIKLLFISVMMFKDSSLLLKTDVLLVELLKDHRPPW